MTPRCVAAHIDACFGRRRRFPISIGISCSTKDRIVSIFTSPMTRAS